MPRSALYLLLMFLGAATFAAASTWWKHKIEQTYVTVNKDDPYKMMDSIRAVLKGAIRIEPLTVDSLPFKPDTIPGDVNKDGRLDVRDFSTVMEVVLYSQYADINGDNKIDLNDIKYLKEYVFGRGPYPKAPTFPYQLVGPGLSIDTTKK